MTNKYRDKYKPTPDSAGRNRRPAGGNDIIELCDTIDALILLVNGAIRYIEIDNHNNANDIQRRLTMILMGIK